jgi:hypothetical protein
VYYQRDKAIPFEARLRSVLKLPVPGSHPDLFIGTSIPGAED